MNFIKSNKVSNIDELDTRYPSIVATPIGGFEYTVNISQPFGDGYTFDQVIALLATATEADVINFKINSVGGQLFSLISLQNAIQETKASFNMMLMGQACSAGGALFLTKGATSYAIGDNTMLMIHPVQAGTGYGSVNEMQVRQDANNRINEAFVRKTYANFLTDDEIDDVIINSREIYLFDQEIIERLGYKLQVEREELENNIQMIEPDLSQSSDDELKATRSLINKELKIRAKVEKAT